MKKICVLLTLGLVLLRPDQAEASFLKRLVGSAVQAATEKVGQPEDLAGQLVDQAIESASQPREPKRKGARQQARQVQTEEARSTAEAPPARPAKTRYTSDIRPSEAVAQQKKAFVEFSRYDCSDCEGGHGYDAWAALALDITGEGRWEAKVAALGIGDSIRWTGKGADGALSVASEEPVEGMRCKQLHYTLMRRSDRQAAERQGLFCFGKRDSYSGQESWAEVY